LKIKAAPNNGEHPQPRKGQHAGLSCAC